MAAGSYLLCFLTAVACAVLLTRAHRATGSRLLYWSALCFAGLSVTNALVIADLVLFPQRDLFMARLATGLLSLGLLLFGMIWEGD